MGNVISDKKTMVLVNAEPIAGEFYTDPNNLEMAIGFCAVIQNQVVNPAPVVFSADDTVGGKVFRIGHGFADGLKVRLTTTGTLPTGLELNTDYYVSNQNAFGFELTDNKEGTNIGEFIEFFDGSGEHTVTPQPFSLLSVTLEGTVDNENYAEVSNSLMQTSKTGNLLMELNNPLYRSCRLKIVVDSGQSHTTVKVLLKGNHY